MSFVKVEKYCSSAVTKSLTQEIKAIPLSLKKNQNINILDITYIKVRVKLFFMETKLNHYLKREKRKMK